MITGLRLLHREVLFNLLSTLRCGKFGLLFYGWRVNFTGRAAPVCVYCARNLAENTPWTPQNNKRRASRSTGIMFTAWDPWKKAYWPEQILYNDERASATSCINYAILSKVMTTCWGNENSKEANDPTVSEWKMVGTALHNLKHESPEQGFEQYIMVMHT